MSAAPAEPLRQGGVRTALALVVGVVRRVRSTHHRLGLGWMPLVLTVLLGLAIPSAAQASPWNRDCGSSRDGSLSPNQDYEVTGPWHIGMQAQTAASIARRIGVGEFGERETAKAVVCAVAEYVATAATSAYDLRWSGDSGTVGVKWNGYSQGPYLGRFACVGKDYGRGSHESCHHDADSHAGAITVAFLIQPFSSS